jgi:hypothetical protein
MYVYGNRAFSALFRALPAIATEVGFRSDVVKELGRDDGFDVISLSKCSGIDVNDIDEMLEIFDISLTS